MIISPVLQSQDNHPELDGITIEGGSGYVIFHPDDEEPPIGPVTGNLIGLLGCFTYTIEE